MRNRNPTGRRCTPVRGTVVEKNEGRRATRRQRKENRVMPDMPIWERMLKAMRSRHPAIELSKVIEGCRGQPYHGHVVALAKTMLTVDKALKR